MDFNIILITILLIFIILIIIQDKDKFLTKYKFNQDVVKIYQNILGRRPSFREQIQAINLRHDQVVSKILNSQEYRTLRDKYIHIIIAYYSNILYRTPGNDISYWIKKIYGAETFNFPSMPKINLRSPEETSNDPYNTIQQTYLSDYNQFLKKQYMSNYLKNLQKHFLVVAKD